MFDIFSVIVDKLLREKVKLAASKTEILLLRLSRNTRDKRQSSAVRRCIWTNALIIRSLKLL